MSALGHCRSQSIRRCWPNGTFNVAVLESRDINPEAVDHAPLISEQLLLWRRPVPVCARTCRWMSSG
jgi:hypothetical protein